MRNSPLARRALMLALPSPLVYTLPFCESEKELLNRPDAFSMRAVKPLLSGTATLTEPLAISASIVFGHASRHTMRVWPDAVRTSTRSAKRPSTSSCPLATSTRSSSACRFCPSTSPEASLSLSVSQPRPFTS